MGLTKLYERHRRLEHLEVNKVKFCWNFQMCTLYYINLFFSKNTQTITGPVEGLAFANLKKISCDTWWVLHKNSRFIQVLNIFLNTCTFKNLQSHAWNIVFKVWFFITQLKLNLNVLLSTLFTAIQLKAIWVKYLCDY